MPIDVVERNHGKILELTATGKFVDGDLQRLEPTFDRLVKQHGKIRVLLQLLDFHDWDGFALGIHAKSDAKPLGEIERLAIVGDEKWEKLLSIFCMAPGIRYFDPSAAGDARTWLEGNSA